MSGCLIALPPVIGRVATYVAVASSLLFDFSLFRYASPECSSLSLVWAFWVCRGKKGIINREQKIVNCEW